MILKKRIALVLVASLGFTYLSATAAMAADPPDDVVRTAIPPEIAEWAEDTTRLIDRISKLPDGPVKEAMILLTVDMYREKFGVEVSPEEVKEMADKVKEVAGSAATGVAWVVVYYLIDWLGQKVSGDVDESPKNEWVPKNPPGVSGIGNPDAEDSWLPKNPPEKGPWDGGMSVDPGAGDGPASMPGDVDGVPDAFDIDVKDVDHDVDGMPTAVDVEQGGVDPGFSEDPDSWGDDVPQDIGEGDFYDGADSWGKEGPQSGGGNQDSGNHDNGSGQDGSTGTGTVNEHDANDDDNGDGGSTGENGSSNSDDGSDGKNSSSSEDSDDDDSDSGDCKDCDDDSGDDDNVSYPNPDDPCRCGPESLEVRTDDSERTNPGVSVENPGLDDDGPAGPWVNPGDDVTNPDLDGTGGDSPVVRTGSGIEVMNPDPDGTGPTGPEGPVASPTPGAH